MSNINFDFGIPSSTTYTTTRLSAYASGSTISVILGGTPIILTTSSINGISYNIATGLLTMTTSGVYYINYRINTTATLLMSAAIYKNGAAITSLTSSPGFSSNTFSGEQIISLNSGDTLQLMLYGLLGTAVLIGGAGASLNIIRLA